MNSNNRCRGRTCVILVDGRVRVIPMETTRELLSRFYNVICIINKPCNDEWGYVIYTYFRNNPHHYLMECL